jgi:hypothetical protein
MRLEGLGKKLVMDSILERFGLQKTSFRVNVQGWD